MLNWINPYKAEVLPAITPSRFIEQTLQWLLMMMSAVGLVYIFFLLDDWAADGRHYISGMAIIHLLLLSVLAMIYADYAGIRAGKRAMQAALLNEPETKNQLTTIHAQARLNVWRLTMMMVGWRLMVVALAVFEVREQLRSAEVLAVVNTSPVMQFPILTILMAVITCLAVGIYLVEPIWRLRLTTAFGIWAALRNQDSEETPYLSRNFFLLVIYWLGLYVLLLVSIGFARYMMFFYSFTGQVDAWLWCLIVGVSAFALLLYNGRVPQRYLRQSQQRLDELQVIESVDQAHQEWVLRMSGWQGYNLWQRFFTWTGLLSLMRSTNPLFMMEARTLKQGGDLNSLRQWTRRIFLRMLLVLAILGGGLLIILVNNYWQSVAYNPYGYYQHPVYGIFFEFLGISVLGLGGISFLASVILDFSSLNAGLNSINRDMAAGRWDLVRLTLLPEKDILVAKHRITQLRAWRILIWVAGMRLLSVILTLIAVFIPDPSRSISALEQIFNEFARRPFLVTSAAITLVIFTTVYLLEPFWRHQAMTALGLAVSAGRNTINGLLAGMGSIVGVWISQAFIFYLLVLGMSVVNSVVFALFYGTTPTYRLLSQEEYELISHLQAGMLMMACFVTATVIFIYYSLLQRLNLRVMQRRAFVE